MAKARTPMKLGKSLAKDIKRGKKVGSYNAPERVAAREKQSRKDKTAFRKKTGTSKSAK